MSPGTERPAATFEAVDDVAVESPTLIEGLPGHGLVAAIAVDQLTEQLGLSHYGSITSEAFPPIVTFEDGLVQDLVRVYAGSDPAVMTLESDVALPPGAYGPLASSVLDDLADAFDRAIFLAGAPAEHDDQLGEVRGVATTESIRRDLREAGVEIPEDPGLVGGVTGALVRECYHAGVPAALLIVRSHPFLPDPGSAKAVIETALEPLVHFDVDTTTLDDQADEISRRMQQVAEQYQQVAQERGDDGPAQPTGMFQ